MNLADLGTAVPAFLALPISFLTALWARRAGDRAASATLTAGLDQARAAITTARVQHQSEHEARQQTALADASSAFLRAADALAATVQRLPDVDHNQRDTQLASTGMTVETTFGPLELLAPPNLLPCAKALLDYCRSLEKLALDRAVLRSAVKALESGWCYLDAESCDHPHHSSAYLAWEFLVDWNGKEEEERWRDRDLLEFCLQDSRCLSDGETARVLALADRLPGSWSQMIGGFVRDPLMERFTSVRTPFVKAVRSTRNPAEVNQ
ncbi:hypothetical protein [Kitasatospora sp. NPDC051914]|uniref:hypothetical protein n=1 Tax=Kitasatospora sp. NPDC051914 TaxID=3154945 RepID=UPI00343A3DDA